MLMKRLLSQLYSNSTFSLYPKGDELRRDGAMDASTGAPADITPRELSDGAGTIFCFLERLLSE